jgi:hypothetical protein
LISSKTPNAFLPITITVSKRDAYITPYVEKFIAEISTLPDLPVSQQGRLPFGKFDLSGASSAILYHEEIRVPAHPKQIIKPGDTWTKLDEYPKYHPAAVSIIQDSLSGVDIRIAVYECLYDSEPLVKVPGGEKYFAAFDTSEADPKEPPREPRKEVPILRIFKGLNQIVLTSPIMEPYRSNPVARPSIQDQLQEESAKSVPVSPGSQNLPIPSPANTGIGSKWSLPIWVYLLLCLVGAGSVLAWLRKSRG